MNLKSYEYLFLLAINPKTHKIFISARASLDYGMSGALIFELMKEGIIVIEDNILNIEDKPTDNKSLQIAIDTLKKINKKSVRKNTSYLANRISAIKENIIQDLVAAEIITFSEGSFLGIVQNNKYFIKNPDTISIKVDQLSKIIKDNIDATTQDVMLLNLIEACGLINKVFPNDADKKAVKNWLKKKQ